MAFTRDFLDPTSSGSRGIKISGAYAHPTDTLATIEADGYFDAAYDEFQRIGVVRVFAVDGVADYIVSRSTFPLRIVTLDRLAPDANAAAFLDNFIAPIGLVSNVSGAAADNSAIIAAAIALARSTNNGRAVAAVQMPAGTFYISETILLEKQFSLNFIGVGKYATRFLWAGAAAGTMMRVHSVRDSQIGGFALIGDGTTIGLDLDATSPNLVSTHNTYRDILIDTHSYGMRIGQSNYQVSECNYWTMDFYRCDPAAVTIKDANAVNHHFNQCYMSASAIGVTAIEGTGGSFSMFGCGFTHIDTYSAIFYPSSRGHTMENCWQESSDSVFAKLGSGGSTAATLTLKECSVNGTSHATQTVIEHAATGSVIVQGGKYGSGIPGSPAKIRSGGASGSRRQNLILDGCAFDGDPLTGAWSIASGPVIMRGVQGIFVMDVTAPAQINGVLAYGTAAAPQVLGNTSHWAGAAWHKIASGTVLSAGLNSFAGTNKNVQGKCAIRVDVKEWGGLTTQGATVTAKDDDGSVNTQFLVEVRLVTGFTLTSDLVFRLQFEPESFAH